MPAFIAAFLAFIQSVGPAVEGIISAISAITSLIAIFHKSSTTIAGKALAMKAMALAAKSAKQTGDMTDLHGQLDMVAAAPKLVTQ